jgi:hypothetical protein
MTHHRPSLAVLLLAFAALACAVEEQDDLFENSGGASAGSPAKGDSPGGAASCENRCDGASEDQSCWCDPGCDVIDDCCADYLSQCEGKPPAAGGAGAGGASGGTGGVAGTGGKAAAGGAGGAAAGGGGSGGTTSNPSSCAGHCGGPSLDGTCYCNPECQASGDCCPDVALCASGAGGAGGAQSGGCTSALCNTEQPASQGGVECYCDANCTTYGDCCANKPQVCGT